MSSYCLNINENNQKIKNGDQKPLLKTGRTREAILLGNYKKVKMKKFAFITGAISFSLTGLGVIFKMNHWHPADMILIVGIGIFSLLFIPSIFKYLYDREK